MTGDCFFASSTGEELICTSGEVVVEEEDVTCVGDASLDTLESGVSESFEVCTTSEEVSSVRPLGLLGECLEPFLGGEAACDPLFGDELGLLSDGDHDFIGGAVDLVLEGERDVFLSGERVLARFLGGEVSSFFGGELSRFFFGEVSRRF